MNVKFDFKNPKNQMVVLAALVAILVVMVYINFLLVPQVIRVVGVAVKNSKAKTEIKEVKNEITNIDKYKKGIGAYKDKVEKYEHMLPAEQEIPSLLENLSAMAKSSGVKIVGITPVAVPENKQKTDQVYQEIPILISARSGYHELGSFLAKLESADRFMKVVDIDVRANRSTPRKHDVELLVLTYILFKGR